MSEVAVIGVPHAKWGETPLAVVVPAGKVDAGELTAWTNARTGRQQRITGSVFVEELLCTALDEGFE